MRHRNKGRSLSRTPSHRLALLRNLSISIIKYGAIHTTLPKAKEVRRFLEKLITKAKHNTLASKRFLFSKLINKESVYFVFSDLIQRFKNRAGGYLRILKIKNRVSDSAPMAIIGFVDVI